MIPAYILFFILWLMNAIFSLFGYVYTLPSIFTIDLDAILTTTVGYFKTFMVLFPPVADVFYALLFYLSFRLSLLVLKAILGHRVPSHR